MTVFKNRHTTVVRVQAGVLTRLVYPGQCVELSDEDIECSTNCHLVEWFCNDWLRPIKHKAKKKVVKDTVETEVIEDV